MFHCKPFLPSHFLMLFYDVSIKCNHIFIFSRTITYSTYIHILNKKGCCSIKLLKLSIVFDFDNSNISDSK